MVSWVLATLHLIALGIGLPAIALRAASLRGTLGPDRLRRVYIADSAWGLAALIWIFTGLARAFTRLEKGPEYYLADNAFLLKMGLLAAILLLEIWPMASLIRWRLQGARGTVVDTAKASMFAAISGVQLALAVAMVFAATAMSRGIWH